MLGPHDVRVRIDPKNSQLAASALVKIGDRRKVNQTIPAYRDDAFRRVAVDGGTRRSDLSKKRDSTDDARIRVDGRPRASEKRGQPFNVALSILWQNGLQVSDTCR
jgi:hypothetical protein